MPQYRLTLVLLLSLLLPACGTFAPVALTQAQPDAVVDLSERNGGGGNIDKGKITLKVTPKKIFIGESVSMEATVTHPSGADADGNPAASDNTVDFLLDGNPHALDVPLNIDNKAGSGWTPAAGDEGTHTATASVSGDYSPGSDTADFTVVEGSIKLEASEDVVEVDDPAPSLTLSASLKEAPNEDIVYRFFSGEAVNPFHESDPTRQTQYEIDLKDHGYGNTAAAVRFRVTTSNETAYPLPDGGDGAGSPLDETHPSVANEADVIWARLSINYIAGNNLPADPKTVTGAPVGLAASLEPAGIDTATFKWTVGGDAILAYAIPPDQAFSKVVQLSESDLDDATCLFYWIDAGNNSVQATATVKGKEIKNKPDVQFEVVKPTVDAYIYPKVPPATTTTEIHGGQNGLGNPILTLSGGMWFEYENFDDKEYGGSLNWLQIINSASDTEYYNNQPPVSITSFFTPALDNAYPYDPNNPTSDGPVVGYANPSPHLTGFQVSHSFTMYLMYTPPHGIPIPLKAGSWNWGGRCDKINNSWTLTSGANNFSPRMRTAMGASSAPPEWKDRATNQP